MSEDRIPPGYYTGETLPPLSPGAAAIIASVDAAASAEGPKALEGTAGEGCASATHLSRRYRSTTGLPGYDPDR